MTFTAAEIVEVYLTRWNARDRSNALLSRLRPSPLLARLRAAPLPPLRRGAPLRIHTHP